MLGNECCILCGWGDREVSCSLHLVDRSLVMWLGEDVIEDGEGVEVEGE